MRPSASAIVGGPRRRGPIGGASAAAALALSLAIGGCGVTAQRSPQRIDVPSRSATEAPSVQATPCPTDATTAPAPLSAAPTQPGPRFTSPSSPAPSSPAPSTTRSTLCDLPAGSDTSP